MYLYQYKGQHLELQDMILQSTLFKCLTSPKLVFTVILVYLTGVLEFIQKYLLADISFGKWLVLAMMIDLLTGVCKVWITKGWRIITSKGLRDTVSKCIQYGSFLIITHILTHFEIDGQVMFSKLDWLQKIAFEFLILIEIKSVYENITAINPRLDFVSYLVDKGQAIVKIFKDTK